jgi:prepilin-type N-terminal cleavage/methylation domain-containing protein
MRRAFTLVELMVAIAVLIVIAALVLPSMDSISESSKFRSACDQLSSAASVCRAEAKRTGKPVAVVATMNEDGRQTIVSVPLGDVALLEEDATIEVDSRVLMVMPAGVSIRAREKGASAAADAAAPISVGVDKQDAETTQSLIIYWADGGATASAPMVVTGPGGRSAGAKVNSWTGALSISSEPDPEVAAAEPEDEGEDVAEVAETSTPESSGGPSLHFEEFHADP